MHTLLVGKTGAGKTHYGKHLARLALESGRAVLLYDPLGNPFPCTWRTSDPDRFLDMAKASRDCLLVIDEAPTICTNLGAHKKFEWLATMSRHNTAVRDPKRKHMFGHRCLFMAQDVTKIGVVYRRNCTHLFLFNVMPSSARLLADEFGDDELLKAPTIPRYHFLYATGFTADGRPHRATLHKGPA